MTTELAPPAAAGLDAHWWETFIDTTQHVTETAVLPHALPPATVSAMLGEVMRVIRTMCLRQSDGGGFLRAYLDGQKLSPDQLPTHVFANAPEPGETVTDWAARSYGQTPFCLIFNYAELLSDRLCRQLSGLVEPFLAQWGIPLNGLHTTTFVGNYGYTPLGIHQDSQGGNVIHFHLGPGPKTMYTWEPDDYARLAQNRPNNLDYAPLLPHAKPYTFGAGDVYYMPWNKFHIGYSDALSVGVTVWFDNHTNDVVFLQLLQHLRDRLFDPARARITHPEHPSATPGRSFTEIDALLRPEHAATANLPFADALRAEYEHHMRRLVSNSGWKISPTPRRNGWHPNVPAALVQLQTSYLRRTAPFPLLPVPTTAKTLLVYCRGEAIPAAAALLPLIDQLNAATQPLLGSDLLATLPPALRPDAATLLMTLYNHGGLTAQPSC
jgi:hypothetical protein